MVDHTSVVDGRISSEPAWLVPSFFAAMAIYLYVSLFLLPRTPILLSGDQVYFWMGAQRMLFGEQIYRDFLQFTPPGTDLFFLALFKMFGPRIWVTNLVVLLLGLASAWVCFRVGAQMASQRLALLGTALYMALVYGKLLNATHHFFSVTIIMFAALVIMRRNDIVGTALAGGVLGVAAFFTQTHGVAGLLAFAVFLVAKGITEAAPWKGTLKRECVLFAGFAAVLATLDAYFVVTVGFSQLWYFQVTYVRRFVTSFPGTFLALPAPVALRTLPVNGPYLLICGLLPSVYLVSLFLCWRARRGGDDPECVPLLSLSGLFLLLEVGFHANWFRLYAVSMPMFILLAWLADKFLSWRVFRRLVLAGVWVCVVFLVFQQAWSRQHRDYVRAELPAGTAAVDAYAYTKLSKIMEHVRPGEFFFQAIWPGVYVPLQLHNALFVDTVWPNEETRPEFVERAIRELEAKRVSHLLWSQSLDVPESGNPSSDHLPPLRNYLREHYRKIEIFRGGDELWERK